MSSVLKQGQQIVDAMNPQERLDLLQYLAPKLAIRVSAMDALTEMRNSREKVAPNTEDSAANWARLKELGREMESQRGTGESLAQILTEMRG